MEENASIIGGEFSSSKFVCDESFKYIYGGRRRAAKVKLFSNESELKEIKKYFRVLLYF
jgi:hypothetical protein